MTTIRTIRNVANQVSSRTKNLGGISPLSTSTRATQALDQQIVYNKKLLAHIIRIQQQIIDRHNNSNNLLAPLPKTFNELKATAERLEDKIRKATDERNALATQQYKAPTQKRHFSTLTGAITQNPSLEQAKAKLAPNVNDLYTALHNPALFLEIKELYPIFTKVKTVGTKQDQYGQPVKSIDPASITTETANEVYKAARKSVYQSHGKIVTDGHHTNEYQTALNKVQNVLHELGNNVHEVQKLTREDVFNRYVAANQSGKTNGVGGK